jgi:hypothetical protein
LKHSTWDVDVEQYTNPRRKQPKNHIATTPSSSASDFDPERTPPAGFEKTVARMRTKRREEEQAEAELALKQAALATAWSGPGGGRKGRATPAKGPSFLEREVEKKPPVLNMEVNVGG